MGCKQSGKEVSLMISLDSRFFQDPEIVCRTSLSSPVQELFREARKRQINQKETYDMKILLGNNTCIDSSSTLSLKDLGINPSDQLKLAVRTNSTKLKVLLQSDPPSKTTISVANKKTIKMLKEKLAKDHNPEDVFIIHRNINLPNSALIKDLNMKDAETLILVLKSSKLLAPWKYKQPGFVVEALCMSSECQAYRQRVSICKGFGSFEVSAELALTHSCPICTQEISKVICCGLAWCRYSADFFTGEVKSSKSEAVDCYVELPNDWQVAHLYVQMLE